jgi:folate-binding protein YgfZ
MGVQFLSTAPQDAWAGRTRAYMMDARPRMPGAQEESFMPHLTDRRIIEVSGEEARSFLHGLVTCTVEPLQPGEARFGALLSAQGKVLYDFFLIATGTGFFIDADAGQRDGLLKRLMLYRLRAKVVLGPRDDLAVVASEAPIAGADVVASFTDPRHSGLGYRSIVSAALAEKSLDDGFDLTARRLALGVPAGGVDYAFGEVFPADVNMDALSGVDYKKGCFVGQEVVARMKHRSTARWRTLTVLGTAPLVPAGTPVLVGEKSIGTMASSLDGTGLALVRIDKAAEARRQGEMITSGGQAISLDLPAYATFTWPEASAE